MFASSAANADDTLNRDAGLMNQIRPEVGATVLAGTAANDLFVFPANFGRQIVRDYHAGEDSLQFDHRGFADVRDVLAHTIDDSQGNTMIVYDATNTVTLVGVAKAQLQAHLSDIYIV